MGFDFLNTEDFVRYLRNRNGTYEYADFTSFAMDFSGNTTGARNWADLFAALRKPDLRRNGARLQRVRRGPVPRQFPPDPALRTALRILRASAAQAGESRIPGERADTSSATNVAPRFGVAVAFNRSRSVVRAGYGIFYARYHTGLITTFFQENGIGQPSIHLETRFLASPQSGPVFPDALPGSQSGDPPLSI